ncbi:MAG: glycosyltransferase [Halobacteriaceae archaeon]
MNIFVVAGAVLTIITGLPYLLYLILYFVIRPSGSPIDKSFSEPPVSIVLPTYNEADIITNKLEDICSLEYPLDQIEVVIVDSSDDETPSLIREFFAERSHPTFQLIEETERRGLAPALNDGYAAASHEIVIKTDCDSYLDSAAIQEAVANFSDPSVGAVTGQSVSVLGESKVETNYRGIQAHIQMLESYLDSTLIFHGPFSAFRKEHIVKIDPNSLADDTELALKIRRQGKRVIFDPAIHYQEAAHSAFMKRRQQKDRRGMGLIRLLIQHVDALGKFGNYGRIVLPFNWWFIIISPWFAVLTFFLLSIGIVIGFGVIGLIFPISILTFIWLGQRDRLGFLQALYALVDTQISLFRASILLLRGEEDGTWEIDAELRDKFE